MFKKLFIIVVGVCLVFSMQVNKSEASESLIISTATTGGTYYPVGVALGTLISIKLAKQHGITATAINSAGSGENVQMLKNNEAQLGILQSLFGLNAYRGKGPYKGQAVKNFRSITMLWENVEHFSILSKYVDSGTIMDLKGLKGKFSIGKRGSGTEGSGRTILKALDIDPESLNLEFLGYNPSAQAMKDGRIVAMNTPAGPPVAAVSQLFAQMGSENVDVLDITDNQLQTIKKQYPIWNRYVLPAGTYPGQKEEIRTISQPNFLAVSPEVSKETVYLITKTIYENLPFLHNIHKATKAMSLDRAINGLPVPLHPGAVKFYKEKGIDIPDSLIKNN